MELLDIRTVPGGPLGVNTYVVGAEGEAECLLIDPGAEVYRVEKAVQGRKVTAVLLTHAHFDHMLYAQPWLDQGARLYVHADDAGKMNRSILDVGGEILAVSQFTLHGDARHGRRPSFIAAARPELAVPMYEAYCKGLREKGIHVETGIFQADMKVSLINDGPVTLLLDSRRTF